MGGSKGRGEGITPCSSKQARPLKHLSLLLRLLLGGAVTAVWPQCHGVVRTDDAVAQGPDESSSEPKDPTKLGYDMTQLSVFERVAYPAPYEGDWVVVKVERIGRWRRWTRRFGTKLSRVKKLTRPGLRVFEMKCFARRGFENDIPLENTVHPGEKHFEHRMNRCRENLKRKGVGASIRVRHTYVLPELYRAWIKRYLANAYHQELPNAQYGDVTVFYDCQFPGYGKPSAESQGIGKSEFHPVLVHQYYHNTLTVTYQVSDSREGRGTTPPLSLGEVDGNVIVSIEEATMLGQPEDFAGQSVASLARPNVGRGRDATEKLEGSDEGQPTAIRTQFLSRPEVSLPKGWVDMPEKLELRKKEVESDQRSKLGKLDLMKKKKQQPVKIDWRFSFRVQEVGKGTPSVAYPVQPQTEVIFEVMPIPEIYMYAPEGYRERNQRGRRRAGPDFTNRAIHVRLQKTIFSTTAKERGQLLELTCGTSIRAVAKCLAAHREFWTRRAKPGVFLSSGNFDHLKTFIHGAVRGEGRERFTKMGLPPPGDWSYVLEGGLTGKEKLYEKRVAMSHFGQEEVRELIMVGVKESPVLKTTFHVPLITCYVKMQAAIVEVSTDSSEETYYCNGDLRVTFDPYYRILKYKTAQADAHSSDHWNLLDYKKLGYPAGLVVLTLGLTERFMYDENTSHRTTIPSDWSQIQISRVARSGQPVVTKIECPGQGENLKQSVQTATTLVLTLERIQLFSPRVVDDVSPPPPKKGLFSRLLSWTPFGSR